MNKNKINDLRSKSSNLKGMSMPVETIVVIAIVILVLVVVMAFFILNSSKEQNLVSDKAAVYEGCTKLVTIQQCSLVDKTSGITLTYDEVLNQITIHDYDGTLLKACQKNGYNDAEDCFKNVCKCPG